MKRIIALILAFLPLCSCMVRTADYYSVSLEGFAKNYYEKYVCQPYEYMGMMMLAVEYDEASKEDKLDSRYDMVRNSLFHIDENTFYLNGIGTFKFDGNIFQTGSTAALDGIMDYVAENSGPIIITNLGDRWEYAYKNDNESFVISFSKLSEGNAWLVGVEAVVVDGDYTATFKTSGGPLKVIDNGESFSIKESYGHFDMDIFRSSQKLDYCYLTYDGSKMEADSSR